MNRTPQIGVMKNGSPAYLAEDDHIHPEVLGVLAEALLQIDETALPPFSRQAVDLGRIVGKQPRLETTADDDKDIVWARRVGRVGYSRFIRNRSSFPTRVISVTLARAGEVWVVFTAYFGTPAPKEPTDPRLQEAEREGSLAFWKRHALVFGEVGLVDEATITTAPQW